jgi:hypothetical protein
MLNNQRLSLRSQSCALNQHAPSKRASALHISPSQPISGRVSRGRKQPRVAPRRLLGSASESEPEASDTDSQEDNDSDNEAPDSPGHVQGARELGGTSVRTGNTRSP